MKPSIRGFFVSDEWLPLPLLKVFPMSRHHIANQTKNLPLRVGIGGPVGSGKTTLLEMRCKAMKDKYGLVVIANDIHSKKDQRLLTVSGALDAERIMGVKTGGCQYTAIREDASINFKASTGLADVVAFIETKGMPQACLNRFFRSVP